MNTAIWTLWLTTFGGMQQSPTPVNTALATYTSQEYCLNAIGLINQGLRQTYAPSKIDSAPTVGVFFCVPGTPAKR